MINIFEAFTTTTRAAINSLFYSKPFFCCLEKCLGNSIMKQETKIKCDRDAILNLKGKTKAARVMVDRVYRCRIGGKRAI